MGMHDLPLEVIVKPVSVNSIESDLLKQPLLCYVIDRRIPFSHYQFRYEQRSTYEIYG